MLRLGEVVIITSNHDHSRDHRVLCDIDNYKEKFDNYKEKFDADL